MRRDVGRLPAVVKHCCQVHSQSRAQAARLSRGRRRRTALRCPWCSRIAAGILRACDGGQLYHPAGHGQLPHAQDPLRLLCFRQLSLLVVRVVLCA